MVIFVVCVFTHLTKKLFYIFKSHLETIVIFSLGVKLNFELTKKRKIYENKKKTNTGQKFNHLQNSKKIDLLVFAVDSSYPRREYSH